MWSRSFTVTSIWQRTQHPATLGPYQFRDGVRKMPTPLTLKNIPDDLDERLQAAAETHRRSLNAEAIVCHETVLLPTPVPPGERLVRARTVRTGLPQGRFPAEDIADSKRDGRP